MTIERTSQEIIFKLPKDIDIISLQNVFNFLKYKTAIKDSKATEEESQKLANESKEGWWKENKSKFL